MSRESILERNRKRAQENDQKMGATALGTSALNYSTQQSLERAAAEKVARESAGGLVDVPQPWLDTITPVTPSSRSARRWSGTTPSSRGGGFGETESQGRGYFSQADYSFLDRANDVIQGGLRQWAGGVGSAAGNVLDRTTSRYNSDAAGQWLDLVQDSMENRDDESYFERPEVQDRLENIRETREQTAPFVQEIYEIAEETGRQGTEQIERAKADLGPVGSFAVDVGTQVPQMLADAAFGAVTGGSALLPLGVRSYGYGVQEAMENGADRDQAAMYGVASGAKEALTEKLFSVALPFSRIYGGGSFDDAIQRGIQTAVERFASTPTGQRIVGGGLSLGASALTEGAEEFISDWLGWQMPRIYGGDVATAEETLSDSLYDFLVGAAVGGLGGVVSPETYNYQLPSRQGNTEGVVNSDTTTGMEAPESPGSVQNTARNDSIPETTRRAVDLLVSGQEITGGQAERIARSPEAVALLSQLTGTEVNTDAPLSQVKADIRAVAGTRAASGTVSTAQTSQGTATMVPQTERTTAQRVHDANRVRGAASSLGMGENGQRAISAAYDGSVDADRYYAGFTAYYEAGLSGRAQEQVRSDYAADLTEAQKFAAYAAGQNDAAASLQREQAGVNYATVYGDEAGFLPSEHSANLSQETTRFYNVLAKATGTKITVTAATGEGGANGWYRDGTIYISSDAQNAGEVVAMHEITHRLQEIAPEAYRKYRDYAVNALSESSGSSSALVERYKTRYAASGVNLTTEEAMDEIAADFTQALTADPQRFERLARDDRSVARKVLDAVKDFIRKVKRAISGRGRQNQAARETFGVDLDTLEQATRLWENALRAGRDTSLQAGARNGRMGTTRNSLKEDGDHGRTREETRGAFLRRAAGAGYAVYEGKTAGAYGYRRVDRESARENARQIQAEVSNLGIEADIISGPILINRNGETIERPVSHAVTIDRARILVNENSTLPPRNVAGHEAFHLWKSGVGRDAYIETVEDNLDFTREGFRNYQSAVSYALFGEEADLSDDGQMARLREELLAYISGDIHEGTNEDALRPMFRDFDAVRAAWERLVEENLGKTRFSLKAPVEEQGTLVALHNLTEEKLLASLNLGGFPMPSIAVTRADIPHENFGEITLVMDRRSVDPKANRKNTVYSADAWTPTFPAIEYEADQKAARRISQRIGELAEQVDPYFRSELQRMQYGQEDYLNSQGGQEGVVQWAMDHYGLKAAYLEEQGTHVKPVTRQQEAEKGYNPERAEKYRAVIQALGTTDPDAIGSMNLKELRDQKGEALEAAFPGMTKSALRMSGILRQVQNFLREDGKPPVYEIVTDPAETRRAVDAALDQAGYEAWVRELYSGLEADRGVYNNKERFTPAGNSRTFRQLHHPVTLDGIVKAMASQNGGNTKNVSGFYGVKSLRAGTARRFNSIVDMHKLEGRLQNLTETEHQAIADALDGRLLEITEELAEKSPAGMRPGDYAQMDSIGYILVEIAEGGTYTIDSVMKKFNDEYRYHIGNELAAKVRDLLFDVSQTPVNLFEAKPERAVGFDEVLAAVVPDDSGKALLDGLNQAGIRTLTYKKDSMSDRLEKVNSVEGARFSLKSTDSKGRTLTQAQQEFFRDSVIRDGQGRLMVMYHGTRNGGFTVFDGGKDYFYFTNNRKYAYTFEGRKANGQLYPATRADMEAGRISPQRYEVYLNVTNPFVAGQDIVEDALYWDRSLAQQLRDRGYDALMLEDMSQVIVLSPEQIKNVTNKAPTNDPDIRRSIRGGSDILRENAALQEENASLRERVEYWRGQTRRTTPGQVDKKAVDRAARELIRDFDSTLNAADISGDLLSLYNYMGTGREGNDELTYTEARRRADEIARRVVESAQVTEDGAYQEYRALREYLRTSPLSISQEDAADIPDYSDFRRRNFGRLNLRGGDTNIDQVYQELSEMWPEFFDETRENNPVDQLLHISEVAEQLYRTTTGNPFAGNLREAQAGVSNEILERFFDIPQVRATFADRAAQAVENERQRGRERVNRVREQRDARIAQLREQNRERVQRAIQRERDTRERQLERLRNRYRARDTAGRDRRTARELRARISRHVRDLSRRLLRPSDKQHIPEQLRTAVAAMLDAINLESVYTVDPETGKRRKGGEGDPTKRTEAFRALRQAYSEITKDGADYTLVIDPDLLDNLDELAAMRDIPLAEMSIPQLTTVWDTVKAVEASVRTANKMLGQSRFQTISQVADGLRSDNILRQDRGDFKGVLGRVDKLVNMDMLTPQSYFHRLGRTGDEVFRMLRAAQDRQIQIMYDAERATRDIIGKTDINKLERETHTFQVEGGTVTLSTAQIMSLYELMKREQAQEHIFTGGIRPEIIPGQRGIRESRRSDPVRVTAENLAEMVGTLTDEQVEMADKLQQYMGGRLSELGNEASMEVYGYRKFTEDHYFPIQVDRNQTQRDISKEAQAQTIAGRGFTKSTAPRANNAVMVNSIFDVYASHVNDMAAYAAWLPTMENMRRIRDFTFRDSEGNRTGTVKDIIERVFGRNGNPYLNKLVDDLNQGVRSTADPGLMDRIVGNYKAASVSANLRVILQQPTAILRALNTLDAKYLLAGTVKRGDWQKVKQYAPIAQWKDWGYFDINTGRQMKDVLFDSDTRLERLRQAGMAGASAADSFTWARLWNAVEAETKDRRKELKPGTKEFYQAVGQRFSEIVDQTQVVDGVLQRSHIMRSPDGLTKMTTSFMGEPTKSYNMFMNAVYDLRHATGKEARRTARRALARTAVALAVSFTINAVMQSLVDGLRDDDKELDYWERVQRAFIGFSGDEESFLDYWNSFWSGNLEASYNPLSYMPYFKDLLSIIQGYDVSRMDAEALEKVFTSGKNFWQALNGEGRYSLAGASASFLAELSRLFGLPVANLKRDIQGTITSAAIETDDYWLQYQIDKALLNIGYSGNRSGFMDILYAASVNDPEAYELIYDDMTASGITQEQIRTSMETRMREAQGVESVADLTRRYLTPDQERTYNHIYSQVTSSAIWSAANEEQREAVEDDLYDLAAGTDAGQKLQEKIDGGASYGISDGDYLLYLAAREIADAANEDPEKRNGSIDQSEAEAAIDMLTGLSDEARAYLWQSTNKGWSEKNNPYR